MTARHPRVPLAMWFVLGAAALLLAGPRRGRESVKHPERKPAPTSTAAGADAAADFESPALDPDAARATIRVTPGLTIQTVAHEPMVQAPVYITFDEDGRLWVVEMTTYMPDSYGKNELDPNNRIVILEDTNGDAVFDKSTTFLDGLVLPRGVAPCHGGALVIEPPSLYFCKDTDGDGRADVRIKLRDGFGGLDSPEHAGNGLLYGLDNWWHLSQHHEEFRFDGTAIRTRNTPAHGQWGITQDDQGRLYYSPNSNPLLIDLYPKHYAARNPHWSSYPGIGQEITPDRRVWPAHITPGVNRGYMENILRPDKALANFTAACSPVIYRAGALGEEYRSNAFVCEAAGNLVKRFRLVDNNGVPEAVNIEEGREFLASTDERFRPVSQCVGPDGALYICDMYRGVIQHRLFVTDYLRAQIKDRKLEQPLNMGRIYRVSRAGSSPQRAPHLSDAPSDELVRLLAHPDGWWRDTAQRLLVERRDANAASAIRAMSRSHSSDTARLHAYRTLEAIGELTTADMSAAAGDTCAPVRAAAVAFLGALTRDTPESLGLFRRLLSDRDGLVRPSAVAAAGEMPGQTRLALLAEILRTHGSDPVARGAAISGAKDLGAALLAELLKAPGRDVHDVNPAVLRDLTSLALRGGSASAWRAVQTAATLLSASSPTGEIMLARIREHLAMDSEEPSVLALDREPEAWVSAMSGARAESMRECLTYFDWPRRPPVERRKKLVPLTPAEQARFDAGRFLFTGSCQACHQPDGRGMPGMAPALTGSRIVQGPPARLARVLLHGLEGEYEVGGSKFEGSMNPAPLVSDSEVAAVMTYIRRSWGNTASAVEAEVVSRERAGHVGRRKAWTREEIER